MSASKPLPRLSSRSVITPFSFSFREEGHEYVIWVEGYDSFLAVSNIGKEALDLFFSGKTLGEVEKIISTQYEEEVALDEFVSRMWEQGFIQAIDQTEYFRERKHDNAFGFIQKKHVSWLLSTYIVFPLSFIIVSSLVLTILYPSLIPSPSSFFWTRSTTVIILANVLLHFLFVGSHEVIHLLVARALGVNGTIRFSTRLTSLVMQTDVTGVWAASRKKRIIVYLSGIIWNLLIIAVALWLIFLFNDESLFIALLKVSILLNLLSILAEFHLYMRTDLYFVLMDILRCRNLFHDSLSYAQYILKKMLHLLRWSKNMPENPIADLSVRERRNVKGYALIAVVGSAVSLGIFAFYSIPIALRLYSMAVRSIVDGVTQGNVGMLMDGSITLLVEILFIGLYIYAFVKNHKQIVAFVLSFGSFWKNTVKILKSDSGH